MSTYKPAWWLPGPHLQTIWPSLFRKAATNIQIERERIELYDGDFIDIDWVGKGDLGPLVLVLHGFEGSVESHYGTSMLAAIRNQGWRGAFIHFRGCSGEPNRLPRGYHSGETTDFSYIVRMLREREPATTMAAIGYSLGGNVLLKWLGETGEANPLKAAVAVSVPFELHKAVGRIQSGFSQVYQWYFLRCLRKRLATKIRVVAPHIDEKVLLAAKTIKDFDEGYTAPLHGFKGADDYYSQSSSRQFLKDIHVPTLLLHAKDDPFMTEDTVPEIHELSPHVTLELMERGGHVGFVAGGNPWRPRYWLDERVPLFFRDYLDH